MSLFGLLAIVIVLVAVVDVDVVDVVEFEAGFEVVELGFFFLLFLRFFLLFLLFFRFFGGSLELALAPVCVGLALLSSSGRLVTGFGVVVVVVVVVVVLVATTLGLAARPTLGALPEAEAEAGAATGRTFSSNSPK